MNIFSLESVEQNCLDNFILPIVEKQPWSVNLDGIQSDFKQKRLKKRAIDQKLKVPSAKAAADSKKSQLPHDISMIMKSVGSKYVNDEVFPSTMHGRNHKPKLSVFLARYKADDYLVS
jgi:ribosomal protein L32